MLVRADCLQKLVLQDRALHFNALILNSSPQSLHSARGKSLFPKLLTLAMYSYVSSIIAACRAKGCQGAALTL